MTAVDTVRHAALGNCETHSCPLRCQVLLKQQPWCKLMSMCGTQQSTRIGCEEHKPWWWWCTHVMLHRKEKKRVHISALIYWEAKYYTRLPRRCCIYKNMLQQITWENKAYMKMCSSLSPQHTAGNHHICDAITHCCIIHLVPSDTDDLRIRTLLTDTNPFTDRQSPACAMWGMYACWRNIWDSNVTVCYESFRPMTNPTSDQCLIAWKEEVHNHDPIAEVSHASCTMVADLVRRRCAWRGTQCWLQCRSWPRELQNCDLPCEKKMCMEMNTIVTPMQKLRVRGWPNRAADMRPVKIVAMVEEYFFRMVSAYLKKNDDRMPCKALFTIRSIVTCSITAGFGTQKLMSDFTYFPSCQNWMCTLRGVGLLQTLHMQQNVKFQKPWSLLSVSTVHRCSMYTLVEHAADCPV